MKKILFLVFLFVFVPAFITYADEQASVTIEFRLVCEGSTTDCQLVKNTKTQEEEYVEEAVLLNSNDIESAVLRKMMEPSFSDSLFEPPSIQLIQFKFTNNGKTKLYELTKKNTGKSLAVIVNGEFMMASRISEPIKRDTLEIAVEYGDESEKFAEDAVSAINSRN
ncbi:MAG: hypothetical protein KAS66_06420 [Candidatus Omnitrophica bacterium]|nr:hypothetical protein [Candidatus Omnitrophota bacterium]